MAEETIPKKLFDAAVKESVYLDKYSAGLAKDVRKLLDDAQNEIVGAIAKNDPTAPIMTKWKAARLEKLNDDINNILNNTYGEIKKEVNSGLKKVGSVQAKSAVNTINGIVGIDVFDVTLTNSNVQGIVENTMIQGNIIGEWWDKQSDSVKSKLSAQMAEGTKAIQIGLVQGESVGDLISRVRGTALKPGVMSLTKREATALVRTSVMQVANAVRQETYKKNADVLDGIEWCSTLDARTTPLCQAMDGKRYDMELNPIDHDMEYPGGPPAHWQCFIDKQIPIYTSKGWVHIGSIKVGDLVLTHKGRFRKVTEIIRTKKQSPEVVTIGLNGWVKVTMTADHPVMSNGRWRRAGDLKDGDSISFLSHKCGRTECNKIVPHFRKYCSLSCRSLEAGKIPWTKERKTSVPAKISRNMLHQYESGLRDRFAVTQKANKATRKLVKQGKASFQRKWVGDKGRNSQRTSLKWKASILDHMMNRNPMTVPGAKKKMIESNNRRIQAHPEKHPNVVMAQRGFVSSIERKMAELLDALGVAYIQQCPIAGKYVDFAIPDLNIVIEVDGEYWHQNDIADRIRQKKIEDAGWQVFRFGERQIKKDIDGVKAEVVRIACNHAGVYEFADFGIIAVKKWKVLRPKTLYNFSVEEDESYIAKGFVVHNCRSTTIPVLKSWAELLKSKKMSEKQIKVLENMSPGMRATINGPIPMNMTYNEWLLTQPVSVQQDILGKGKWKLWSENKLSVSDLVDNTGRPLTIEQLNEKLGTSIIMLKDLIKDSAKLYSESISGGRTITAISKDIINGETEEVVYEKWLEEHIKATKVLLSEIRKADVSEVPLYRSLVFHEQMTEKAKILKIALDDIKVGETISFDRISSFSLDQREAAYYGVSGKSKQKVNYRLEIVGPHKAFETDSFTGLSHKESITEGLFEVIGIKGKSNIKLPDGYKGEVYYLKTIVIRQKEVF